MFNGAAIGRAAEQDFELFGGSVETLDGGVVLSVGSAIMGPQVFEKSLSCVNNLRLQDGRADRRAATPSTSSTSRTAAAGTGRGASRPRRIRPIISGSARATPGWGARCTTSSATTRRSSTTSTTRSWPEHERPNDSEPSPRATRGFAIAVVGDFCLDRYLEIDPRRPRSRSRPACPSTTSSGSAPSRAAAGTILNNLVALGDRRDRSPSASAATTARATSCGARWPRCPA